MKPGIKNNIQENNLYILIILIKNLGYLIKKNLLKKLKIYLKKS